MNHLSRPPVQLSEKALSELKIVLEHDIGKEALSRLSEAEINHIGYVFLSLTAIQLKIRIREKKLKISMDSLER